MTILLSSTIFSQDIDHLEKIKVFLRIDSNDNSDIHLINSLISKELRSFSDIQIIDNMPYDFMIDVLVNTLKIRDISIYFISFLVIIPEDGEQLLLFLKQYRIGSKESPFSVNIENIISGFFDDLCHIKYFNTTYSANQRLEEAINKRIHNINSICFEEFRKNNYQ